MRCFCARLPALHAVSAGSGAHRLTHAYRLRERILAGTAGPLCSHIIRVGQNCISAPCMTVCVVVSLLEIPYALYISISVWFWPTLHLMATKPTFCCVWSCPPAVQVKTISEELPTLYGYQAHFMLCLVMPSRCTGQNNQRGAPYTLWLPSPLFVVSGHALPLYRSKQSSRSSLHFMATKPTLCCVWSYPPAVQVKTISEELGVGFMGSGFDPKWQIKDIPLMPKDR